MLRDGQEREHGDREIHDHRQAGIVELEALDAKRSDSVAYEIGRSALHGEVETGEDVVDRGKYVLVHEGTHLEPGAAARSTGIYGVERLRQRSGEIAAVTAKAEEDVFAALA